VLRFNLMKQPLFRSVLLLGIFSQIGCAYLLSRISGECPNGKQDEGEECDDGNAQDGDACESDCTLPRCGNLIIDQGETCDDGCGADGICDTNDDNDGCSAACLTEFCGDGITNNGDESCDDGASNSDTAPSACRTNCQPPVCGDGVVDNDEECDDGNIIDGDTCEADCTDAVCGNLIVDQGEACDDGNQNDEDICNNLCQTSCGDGSPGTNIFTQTFQIPSGTSSGDNVLADFDQDGILDAAVTNFDTNKVSVFFGNGDGSFRQGPTLSTDNGPIAVVALRLDDNDTIDIVVANTESSNFNIFFGNGAGAFTQGPGLFNEISQGMSDLLAVNLDNTDQEDFIATNPISNTAVGFRMSGADFFSLTSFSTAPGASLLNTGDFNLDGRLDLVVTNSAANSLSTFLFTDPFLADIQRQDIPLSGSPTGLDVGDLNLDGIVDLVVSVGGQDLMQVALGDGNGGFLLQPIQQVSGNPSSLRLVDLDQDGLLDVAFSRQGEVRALLGDGRGGFYTSLPLVSVASPANLSVGDLNNDGHPDLVVTLSGANNLLSILSTPGEICDDGNRLSGDGCDAQCKIEHLCGDGLALSVFESCDDSNQVDGDGCDARCNLEFACGNTIPERGEVCFQRGPNAPVLSASASIRKVKVSDVDGDQDLDLVGISKGSPLRVNVFLNNGDSTFAPVITSSRLPPFSFDSFPDASLQDFDEDGFIDAATISDAEAKVIMLFGDGTGSFTERVDSRFDVHNLFGASPSTIFTADFNQDNHLDLLVGGFAFTEPALSVLLGDGQGSFTLLPPLPTVLSPLGIAVSDLNLDTIPDIIAASFSGGQLAVYLGNGDGSFSAETLFSIGTGVNEIVVGRLGDDAFPDVVTANFNSNDLSVLYGDGTGDLSPEQRIPTGLSPRAVSMGHLDGDNRLDLVVSSDEFILGGLSVFLLNPDGSLQPRIVVSGSFSVDPITTGDLNDDNIDDVIMSNANSALLPFFSNP
jgi:cysteine-rich repeat protein